MLSLFFWSSHQNLYSLGKIIVHENGPFSHYTVLSRKLFDYKSLNEKDVCLNNCFISVVNQSHAQHGSLLPFSSLAIKGLLSVNLVSEKNFLAIKLSSLLNQNMETLACRWKSGHQNHKKKLFRKFSHQIC